MTNYKTALLCSALLAMASTAPAPAQAMQVTAHSSGQPILQWAGRFVPYTIGWPAKLVGVALTAPMATTVATVAVVGVGGFAVYQRMSGDRN